MHKPRPAEVPREAASSSTAPASRQACLELARRAAEGDARSTRELARARRADRLADDPHDDGLEAPGGRRRRAARAHRVRASAAPPFVASATSGPLRGSNRHPDGRRRATTSPGRSGLAATTQIRHRRSRGPARQPRGGSPPAGRPRARRSTARRSRPRRWPCDSSSAGSSHEIGPRRPARRSTRCGVDCASRRKPCWKRIEGDPALAEALDTPDEE